MACILCIDNCTYELANTVPMLRTHGHQVLAAIETADVLNAVANHGVEVVVLNCSAPKNTSDIVLGLRLIRPDIAIVMMSAYCPLPCDRHRYADCCIQKGDSAAALLRTLDTVLCAKRYGLCRCSAA